MNVNINYNASTLQDFLDAIASVRALGIEPTTTTQAPVIRRATNPLNEKGPNELAYIAESGAQFTRLTQKRMEAYGSNDAEVVYGKMLQEIRDKRHGNASVQSYIAANNIAPDATQVPSSKPVIANDEEF